jgi:hypothetical protein
VTAPRRPARERRPDHHPQPPLVPQWRQALEAVQRIDPAATYVRPGEGGSGDYVQLSARFGGGALPNPARVHEWLSSHPVPVYPRPVPADRPGLSPAIKRGWRQALNVPCRDCPEGAAV